ncbi:pentatricopeptide repeat-containing protein [Pyrus ussuriensis x Pyrus communis]|uniref:Pentatricopeptide repeat-containing protein n=1 Tax=Pyrus ussuriensis x Pyrus communis TaxID=2448454 RepID=A0A5N5GSX8_9ROSA|nr:pentatricopeptide repeat-containing protein [Pyrus ussuriensis x Pyrus communis]
MEMMDCRENTCPHRVFQCGKQPFVFKPLDAWERFGNVKVHGFGVKTGIGFDAYVCYSHIDIVESFKQVFDICLRETGFVGTLRSRGILRCRRFEEALDVFRGMRCESNVQSDEATVLGKKIHECVRSELGFTTRTGNA